MGALTSFVATGHVGFTREYQDFTLPNQPTEPLGQTVLGLANANLQVGDWFYAGFPQISIEGLTAMGSTGGAVPFTARNWTLTFAENNTWVHRNHELSFGLEANHNHLNQKDGEFAVTGTPRGSANTTEYNTFLNLPNAPVGFSPDRQNSIAELDLGLTNTVGKSYVFNQWTAKEWQTALYLGDRWRVTPKKLGVPLMAGSSIPVALRSPDGFELPLGTPVTEAIGIGHGDLDAYGFHLLEGLQCQVERRKGAETGIGSVEWIEGDAIWKCRDSDRGSWSKPLLEEAMRLQPGRKPGTIEQQANKPVLFLLQYRDGMKAAALILTRSGNDRSYAMRVPGQERPVSVLLGVNTKRPLPHFDGFVRYADELMDTGKPPYPVERTLLTTKTLSMCFESRRAGKALETPQLNVEYKAPAHQWFQHA